MDARNENSYATTNGRRWAAHFAAAHLAARNLPQQADPPAGARQEKEAAGERRARHKGAAACLPVPAQRRPALISILLPLLFLFLLPSIKYNQQAGERQATRCSTYQTLAGASSALLASPLLLSLIEFPLDRFKLEAGLIGFAGALVPRRELNDEEAHLQLLALNGAAEPNALAATGNGYLRYAAQRPSATSAAGPFASTPMDIGEQLTSASEYGQPTSGDAGEPPVGSLDGATSGVGAEISGVGSSGIQARTDLPSVRALNVKCEKNHMTVNIVFDRPFYGTVFSKGHYNDQKCVHLPPNSGQTSINFDIHLGKCGMSSSDTGPGAGAGLHGLQQQQGAPGSQPNGLYIENTIIIQYDPQVQEIYDQARRLRCTWYDYYEKSVTFRPYDVDMLDAVTANFLGDNIQCWMQIQVGKGPWSTEVAGIVKIGQTMTMILAIKDDENRFDMLVRNCVAHDGKHQPIQLVDEYGCVARPKIMARFQKVRNYNQQATVLSYAHFQAFKFPDSMSVHFQCVIQVCRQECPEPVCSGAPQVAAADGRAELPAAAPPADYATSGTEIVSSKESLPGAGPSYFLANHSLPGHSPAKAAVHLKLEESQARAQVKLDTSMMAGAMLGGAQRVRNALPPQLLHLAASGVAEPAPGSVLALPVPVGYGAAAAGRASGQAYLASGAYARQAEQSVRPAAAVRQPAGLHAYSQQRFAQRLGDQPEPEPEEGGWPAARALSAIAQPRALNHRQRRSIAAGDKAPKANATGGGGGGGRHSRSNPRDSTQVQTQKTIQVVSPEDVAFNLLELEELVEKRAGAERVASSVCFSTARLITAILVTLVALAVSIVIVAYVLLKQRAAEQAAKIADMYHPKESGQQQQQPHVNRLLAAPCQQPAPAPAPPPKAKYSQTVESRQELMLACRQQEEMRQRNNYLARLYSQFMPATYWSQ